MHGRINNKKIITCIITILVLSNMGCVRMVDGYKQFEIKGFEEFFNIESLDEQEEYISSGKLDFYKREEILFLPFIKEISDTECAILIFPYSEEFNNKISLEEISLKTSEGNILSFTEKYGEIEVSSVWSDSMMLVNTFNKSEEWFYDGNELALNIKASIEKENECIVTEISYNVIIKGYKGTALQV